MSKTTSPLQSAGKDAGHLALARQLFGAAASVSARHVAATVQGSQARYDAAVPFATSSRSPDTMARPAVLLALLAFVAALLLAPAAAQNQQQMQALEQARERARKCVAPCATRLHCASHTEASIVAQVRPWLQAAGAHYRRRRCVRQRTHRLRPRLEAACGGVDAARAQAARASAAWAAVRPPPASATRPRVRGIDDASPSRPKTALSLILVPRAIAGGGGGAGTGGAGGAASGGQQQKKCVPIGSARVQDELIPSG